MLSSSSSLRFLYSYIAHLTSKKKSFVTESVCYSLYPEIKTTYEMGSHINGSLSISARYVYLRISSQIIVMILQWSSPVWCHYSYGERRSVRDFLNKCVPTNHTSYIPFSLLDAIKTEIEARESSPGAKKA